MTKILFGEVLFMGRMKLWPAIKKLFFPDFLTLYITSSALFLNLRHRTPSGHFQHFLAATFYL